MINSVIVKAQSILGVHSTAIYFMFGRRRERKQESRSLRIGMTSEVEYLVLEILDPY